MPEVFVAPFAMQLVERFHLCLRRAGEGDGPCVLHVQHNTVREGPQRPLGSDGFKPLAGFLGLLGRCPIPPRGSNDFVSSSQGGPASLPRAPFPAASRHRSQV
jgi:hypothetical protein